MEEGSWDRLKLLFEGLLEGLEIFGLESKGMGDIMIVFNIWKNVMWRILELFYIVLEDGG